MITGLNSRTVVARGSRNVRSASRSAIIAAILCCSSSENGRVSADGVPQMRREWRSRRHVLFGGLRTVIQHRAPTLLTGRFGFTTTTGIRAVAVRMRSRRASFVNPGTTMHIIEG